MYNVFFPICICTFVYITFFLISWFFVGEKKRCACYTCKDLLNIKNKMETFTIIVFLKATIDNNEALYLRFNLK